MVIFHGNGCGPRPADCKFYPGKFYYYYYHYHYHWFYIILIIIIIIASFTQQATRPASTGSSMTCTWRTFISSLKGFGMISLVFLCCRKDKRKTHKSVPRFWPHLSISWVFQCHEIKNDFDKFGLFCDFSEEQGFIKFRMCWFDHAALPLPKTSHPHLQKFGLCKM